MFKATNSQSNEDVVILDPKWFSQTAHLRKLDRKDNLICPGCRQPVRLKAGQKRRWHFAHKHLKDCPLSHESPIILEARAVLYGWLVSKFKEDAVTLEYKPESSPLQRPIDCWVETKSSKIGYWIIGSQIKPHQRDELERAFEQEETQINWVFLTEMLREEKDRIGNIHLTTTEREFMHRSDYNDFIDHYGELRTGTSLHYLDPSQEILITFRTLEIVHAPQLYSGRKQVHKLSDVLVYPKTGEFVHPGEYEYLQKTQKQRAEINRRQEEWEREQREQMKRFAHSTTRTPPKIDVNISEHPVALNQEDVCILCGKAKREWGFVTASGKRICRECYGI